MTDFGATTDIPVVGDWNDDGIDTIGVFRPSTAEWFLMNTNWIGTDTPDIKFTYGIPGDVPLVGDWDNTNGDSIGIYRPSDGKLYSRNTLSGGFADIAMTFPFGTTGAPRVSGDWDGSAESLAIGTPEHSPGVVSTSTFYLTNKVQNGTVSTTDYPHFAYGIAGDIPITGYWTGNQTCRTTIGIFRNGFFGLRRSLTAGNADIEANFGTAGDKPLVGRWGTLDEELEAFGIRLNGTWSANDKLAILKGVRNTSHALARLSSTGLTPLKVFRRIMYGARNNSTNETTRIQEIHFTRGTGTGATCVTTNSLPSSPSSTPQAIITCDVNMVMTEYAAVHELGHVFNNRSNWDNSNPEDSLVERMDSGVVISDCAAGQGDRVLGAIGLDWERGDRGWGSGPAFSAFQQNPGKDPGQTAAEIDEAAADMFLNWVYRRLTDSNPQYFNVVTQANDPRFHRTVACVQPEVAQPPAVQWSGFINRSWLGSQCSTTQGCSDITLPGNTRYSWMTAGLREIFALRGW